MKRILWLSCCLLIGLNRSMAQVSFPTAIDHGTKGTTPLNEATSTTSKAEPVAIPAGTHLLMKLTSALHTTSATAGAGVYLETSFPVIANNRVVIPEHTRVLGVVEREQRPGRVKGRARMLFRFTTMILPDNRVLSIAGALQSLPGSTRHRPVDDEGTIEPVDQIDGDVYTVAKTTGVGILIGSVSHIGIGVGPGALMGAGFGVAKVLFTRGDEIALPVGTRVEMVLKRPLTLEPES